MPLGDRVITVTALCLIDDIGRLLIVRKRGTSMFMQPGGKPDAGETPEQAGVRELEEELGLRVPVDQLTLLGTWEGPAANEADTLLRATVFLCPLLGEAAPASEIETMDWLGLDEIPDRTDLAPLLTEFVLPALRARR